MPWRTILCTWLLGATALVATAAAQDEVRTGAGAGPPPPLLDVPFVPQREALCGGAAVAMVFRYWGGERMYAEDFASLVDESAEGIRLNELSHVIIERGWGATTFSARASDVQHHLREGRPLIALIEDRPGRHHYVVVVAWTAQVVVFHDPAHGPFRILDVTKFDAAWAVVGHTALLVLPPVTHVPAAPAPATTSQDSAHTCPEALDEAIRLAHRGELLRAETLLLLARRQCPGGAARELAGIRFKQERWADAEHLASQALAHDPSDTHAWQLLAAARFLRGDTSGALDAWNRRDEPRVDLARVAGLDRMRYETVADLLSIAPDDLITEVKLARARRRISMLPGILTSRVSYTPRAHGRAIVDVALLEKALVPRRWPALSKIGLHAAVARELRLDSANAIGDGELWTAAWRWWAGRPRVLVGLATPQFLGATGQWRIEGSWEQQLFRHGSHGAGMATPDALFVSERRRANVSFADWASGDLRWELSGGIDRWVNRGSHVSGGAAVERRLMGDRVAVRADGTVWSGIGRGAASFGSAAVGAAWRSAQSNHAWTARAGIYQASDSAPWDLWPAADTGQVRSLLLRAHPLLSDDAIRASDVSRVLAHATIELQRPTAIRLPGRLWWATFLDVAKRGAAADGSTTATLADVGAGLRIDLPGTGQRLRVDIARGLRDGRMALSVGWQTSWTGW